MVPASHVLAFAAVVTVLIVIPGPSVLFTISRALRAIRDGFAVGVTNPKSIVFFVVALPEFTTRTAGHWPVPLQMLILGAVFPAIALFLDSGWAAIAGTAREWLVRSPRRLALIGGTGGLVMIGLGVSLAATGRKD
jgi:threonine/homoserine/homoserine lactone efflux protein